MPKNFCVIPYCLIPLSSEVPLWEWDIVSDSLFMSSGARLSLKLANPPHTMREFYKLLASDAASELVRMHESAISGRNGSTLEYTFHFHDMWVRERLLVLSRNSEGRATRIMGNINVSSIKDTPINPEGNQITQTGVWSYHVPSGQIWRDKVCEVLLGTEEGVHYPISSTAGLFNVHPSEREALRRHYEIFCSGTSLGESITDVLRVRHGKGEYLPMLARASCLERDEKGHAVLISGVLAPSDPYIRPGSKFARDNSIYHALNTMGAGQWNWDTKINEMYFCPRYLAMLGYSPEEEENFTSTWSSHIHPDDYEKVQKVRQAVAESPENGDIFECTYRMKHANGGWAWIFDRGCVTWRDADGHAGHMLGSITNITTAQAERDKLEALVRHDSLTGLRSRAFLNLEIEHIEQNRIRPVSVISIDINGLKMINDNLGHAAGDELLTKAASLLRGTMRATDCIGRIGGDEFLVLLPNCNQKKAEILRDKIAATFDKFNSDPETMPVFAAYGTATADSADEKLSDLIARADAAMYANKKAARPHTHAALKKWIKTHTGKEVGDDERLGS